MSSIQDAQHWFFDSPIGLVEIQTQGKRIVKAGFVRAKRMKPERPSRRRDLHPCLRELKEYFIGKRKRFQVPLLFQGTPAQKRIWVLTQGIPYGKTVTYKALASRAGQPGHARVVARILSQNPLAIFVPCHRVVPSPTGSYVGGYAWGVKRKKALLSLEKDARYGKRTFIRYHSRLS